MAKNIGKVLCAVLIFSGCGVLQSGSPRFYVPVTVDRTTLKVANTPCEAEIDFSKLLENLGAEGAFNRHSVVIEGKNPATGKYTEVDYRVGEHYKYGDSGKVYWLIENPEMTEFRVWFDKVTGKSVQHQEYIPAIGVGDEIMFNTPEPVPLIAMTGNLLTDFNSDGITDALSINHYCYRFGWPYDGIMFHPGIKEDVDGITVSDFYRIHYIPRDAKDDALRPLHARYNWVCPVDWDVDGLLDLLYISIAGQDPHKPDMPENAGLFVSNEHITFFRNTGNTDISGMPILRETKHYPATDITKGAYVPGVAAEDLDGDRRTDIIGVRTNSKPIMTPEGDQIRTVSVLFYRNTGNDSNGLPELAEPVMLSTKDGEPIMGLNSAHVVSFGDVNADGKIDIICNNSYKSPALIYWYENKGGSPPVFARKDVIEDLPFDRRGYRWVRWNGKEGLMGIKEGNLVARTVENGELLFTHEGSLHRVFGPLIGGSQEKPEWVDWDNDGDMDLLTGESYGRIHLYENTGSRNRPKFNPPVWITSEGEPIRIYRNGIFGGQHWHGAMGYPSVACIDWDRDDLFDLVIPNETNRVYWYRNIGETGKPEFGKRQQILPDGFSDSKEKLERTRLKALNDVYVFEEDIPFYWRTRLAITDYTGDGLEDIIGLNGIKNLVLYERYLKETGELGLRPGKQLFYNNGSPIKKPHYFKMRNVDWDGDGLMDIIVTQNLFSSDQRSLLFLKNVGTREMPVFEQPEALKMWGKVIRYSSHGLQPSLIDWEEDGSLDFVGCNESGLFVLFRNAVLNYPKPKVRVGSPKEYE